MHPFYGPNSHLLGQKTSWLGLISMMAYLLFWAAAIPITIRMLTRFFPQAAGSAGGRDDTAERILRERYASGEIELAEFILKKVTLEREECGR